MKVRTGFVSNSSSQSFVIAKCYMTETQVKQFGDWLSKMQDDAELTFTLLVRKVNTNQELPSSLPKSVLTRNTFVSINKMKKAKADGWEAGWGGYNEGKTLVFLGNECDYDKDDNPINYQPHTVGIEAEEALKAGKTVPELKKKFIEAAKALSGKVKTCISVR